MKKSTGMEITWRERIQLARERGYFNKEDWRAWASTKHCLVGESVCALVNMFGEDCLDTFWIKVNWPDDLWGRDVGFQQGLLAALNNNDFDFVENRLNEIEDRALQVKREMITNG